MAAPVPEHVPVLKKLAYAAPAFALAVVGIPVYVYLPKFYTDTVGIDITALGYILASVRIFDAVTDPPMGYLSDRTVSRFGRRRPYNTLCDEHRSHDQEQEGVPQLRDHGQARGGAGAPG